MRLTVAHQGNTRYTIRCRSHEVTVDLPHEAGGTNQGMNAPELFGAALAACIGVYVVEHCEAAGTPHRDLKLHVDWKIADNPRRMGEVLINIDLSNEQLDAAQRDGILSVARRCLLSNTLLNAPSLQVHLQTAQPSKLAAAMQ